MKRSLTYLLILIVFLPVLTGQQEQQLDTITITDRRLELLRHGHRVVSIDSATRQIWQSGNLADLLAAESDVFIKHYGLGSLATTSLRGGGAAHTAFIWNGFRIQSPMNGQNDWSLLPVFFLDHLRVQYGGSASMYGSGSVGGAIHSNNMPQLGQGLKISLHEAIGSFGFVQHGLDAGYSDTSWSVRSRFFHRTADNDFTLPGSGFRQSNAALQQTGWLGEGSWQASRRDLLQVWAWAQQSERQIPPTLSAEQSFASQQDDHLRLAADWTHQREHGTHTVRTALSSESLLYTDPVADLTSDNRSRQWMLEAESTWLLGRNQELQAGVHQLYQQAHADGFAGSKPQQYRLAAFASWQWRSDDHSKRIFTTLRQGTLDGELAPITPSLGGTISLTNWLDLRGQAGRTFRLPTFNDLYWSPGGNPDLQPETGWNQEIGVSFSPFSGLPSSNMSSRPLSLLASATFFNQTIDNWILWRPGPAFWYPENVRSVWSRGIESSVELSQKVGGWTIRLSAGHTWTKATVRKVTIRRDRSQGQQLIYTPEHQARANLSAEWNRWKVRYGHLYTGRRYTATDGSNWLAPFHLGNLFFSHCWTFSRWRLQGGFRCDNLWNTSYQVMDNRPMPPRSYQLSLDLSFHHPN